MKNMKKFLAILLALSFIVTIFSFNVFADDAVESPIIPIPSGPKPDEWYQYELNTEAKTAVLSGFNFASNRTKITVRSTYTKDSVEYAVVGVGKDVFKGTAIQSVVIEEGVEYIAEGAFADCASLTAVEVADSVIDIDSTAFDGSKWLENQPDGVIYLGKVAYKAKGISEAFVALKSDTVAIADGAFKNQTILEKIVIPEATTIGDEAFSGCTALTIYCYENSPAAAYAQANEIPFVMIPALFLKSAPAKLSYYQGDAINLSGIEVVSISEAGEVLVEVTPEMISGYDATVLGVQSVTVTFNGLTVSFEVTVLERPPYIPGDVDGNGDVDLNDAIHLLYYVNFPASYSVNQPVDFDGNATEDLNDAIYLLYYVNFPSSYPLN